MIRGTVESDCQDIDGCVPRGVIVTLVIAIAGGATLGGAPRNDECNNPTSIVGLPFTAVEAAIEEATTSNNPPDPVPGCANPGNNNSVWYEFTASVDGWIHLSTAGSDFDSVAWVGTGSCGAWTEIACDDDSAGALNANLSFETQAGQTYAIMIGSWSPIVDGTLHLLVEEELNPPDTTSDETWTLADSPVVISGTHTIIAGVTVTVEPGVVIQLQPGALLLIEGSLVGAGTPAMPISFSGSNAYPTRVRVPGSLTLSNAVVDIVIEPGSSGSLQFTDTTFSPTGTLSSIVQGSGGSFISLDRCTFNGTYLWLNGTTIRLQDTSVAGNFLSVGSSYVYLDGVSVIDAPQWSLNLVDFEQPVYINNVIASNSADGGIDVVAANVFIGPDVELTNNAYPVKLGGSGILPGSVLPASGNLNNYIKVEFQSFGAWSTVWADTGIPYAWVGEQDHPGALQILPGVTVLLEPDFTVWDDQSVIDARGLPGAPVRFQPLVPGQSWQGLQYFYRFENCVIDGGQVGARFHSITFPGYIDNCIIQNNDFGMQNDGIVRKTRFINNTIGTWSSNVPESLESLTNPNSFVGNGIGVQSSSGLIDARHNWWGDPSGPNSPNNPGGSGDAATSGVFVLPFLTAEPDFNDDPPIVRLLKGPRRENVGGDYSSFVDPGSTVIISWDSLDEVAVTAHRIEFYDSLNATGTVVAELPGWQRSFEWHVPDVGFSGSVSILRVVAIDPAGQEGWDQHKYLIPSGQTAGTLTVSMEPGGGPYLISDMIGPLCFVPSGTSPYDAVVAEISFDGDQRHIPLGSAFVDNCLGGTNALGPSAPFVSTDTARFRLHLSGGQNQVKYFFSDYFTIRPDPRLGDAAPSVTMTSPSGGESFVGGGVVPIHWTATDDESVRASDIQVSTDGGRTWQFIAEGLPPTATSFDWQLPPSSGLNDVRVRVMVSDLRFQTSSSGGDVAFSITPGSGGPSCTQSPDEVSGLTLGGNKVTLQWSPTVATTSYDVARGDANDLQAGLPATCVSSTAIPSYDDLDVPVSGRAYYYLVRATNDCGSGPWAPAGQARNVLCP